MKIPDDAEDTCIKERTYDELNNQTKLAIEDAMLGRNLTRRYDSLDEFFKDAEIAIDWK